MAKTAEPAAVSRINSGGDAALSGGLKWDAVLEFSDYGGFGTGIQNIESPAAGAARAPLDFAHTLRYTPCGPPHRLKKISGTAHHEDVGRRP